MHWFFRYHLHHILFWICYFAFWTAFSVFNYHSTVAAAMGFTLVWFVGQASCVYACMYLLVPRYFHTRQYWTFTGLSVLAIVICSVFIAFSNIFLLRLIAPNANLAPIQYLSFTLMANFYATCCMAAAKIIKDRIVADRRNRRREKEQMQHELSFLRSQLNPHFLFNAINSIYVLIRKDPETAAQLLAKFSDMLRYQLYECTTENIPVEKELSYLGHYLALEKIRKGSSLQLDYTVDDTVRDFSIAPLLLITFIENAFKHLSTNSGGQNYVRIAMGYDHPVFTLQVENSKDEAPLPQELPGGIGQQNVKRRLELLYPERHSLDIRDMGKKYVVLLRIVHT